MSLLVFDYFSGNVRPQGLMAKQTLGVGAGFCYPYVLQPKVLDSNLFRNDVRSGALRKVRVLRFQQSSYIRLSATLQPLDSILQWLQ